MRFNKKMFLLMAIILAFATMLCVYSAGLEVESIAASMRILGSADTVFEEITALSETENDNTEEDCDRECPGENCPDGKCGDKGKCHKKGKCRDFRHFKKPEREGGRKGDKDYPLKTEKP